MIGERALLRYGNEQSEIKGQLYLILYFKINCENYDDVKEFLKNYVINDFILESHLEHLTNEKINAYEEFKKEIQSIMLNSEL